MSNVIKNQPAPVAPPASPAPAPANLGSRLRAYFRNDLGFIPVLVTLVLIAIFFQITSGGHFLQTGNLVDLLFQTITVGTMAIGAGLVLFLGEIDLSLAAIAYTCGAVMAVMVSPTTSSRGLGLPPVIAIIGALLLGAIIGLFNGFFVAVLRVPSFIVTLAGSIGFAGLVLVILGPNSTLPISDPLIQTIATGYLPIYLGIGLPALAILAYIASQLITRQRRQAAGLKVKSIGQTAIELGGIAIFVAIVLIVLQLGDSTNGTCPDGKICGGVPIDGLIWLGLVAFFWILLTRTSYGRHVYAVGGNSEASRRAGINVTGIKISIFVLAATLAATSGVLQASRQASAPSDIPATLLLQSVAAAVIGGISLFGGRGSIWSVLLGALIIKSLENGLALLNQTQSVVEIVEGSVLLLAVTVDALLRRNQNVRR